MNTKRNQNPNLKSKALTQPIYQTKSTTNTECLSVEAVESEKVSTKPVPQYKILSEKNSFQTLQTEVEKLMSEGWSLQGGVSVAMYSSPYETVTVFSQSLTKII
jgi:hypothetical protein